MKERIDKSEWLLCPTCKRNTRIKIRDDTILENFPPKKYSHYQRAGRKDAEPIING